MEFNLVKRKKADDRHGSPNSKKRNLNKSWMPLDVNALTNEEQKTDEEEITIIIQLGEKAIEDKLIYNKASIQELLRQSPFHEKHSGFPRYQFDFFTLCFKFPTLTIFFNI